MQSKGIKHLIQCRCILPTLKNKKDPPFHSFVVFSVEEEGSIVEKLVSCNNCGIVHRIFDYCKSEILNNFEGDVSSLTIEDIKLSLPSGVASILDSYNKNISDYEHVKFMIEKEVKDFVVLSHEFNDDRKTGKILKHKGKGKFEIEPFSKKEFLNE